MFHDARLKVERAERHISDIQSIVSTLPESDVSGIEVDAKSGGHSITHHIPHMQEILTDVALITGDAVHNLRASLDYAWLTILEALNLPVSKFSKFPFVKTAKELEAALVEKKIDTASPALFHCMISKIKPYPGGNDLLCALHELDILDKHKLLLTVVSYGGVTGIRVEDEHGAEHRGDTWGTFSPGLVYVDFQPQIKIKDHGKLTIEVIFGEQSPLQGSEVWYELKMLSATVLHCLSIMEKLI